MASELLVNKITPESGTTLTLGESGDTISFGTGTTPQLGGDLDLNSNDITGTGNINITGTATVSGDLTVDTDTLYVDSTNNYVGIGTTSPSGYSSTYRQLVIDGGANPSMLQLNNTATGSGTNTGGLAIVQNGVDAFLINPQATGTTRFFTNNTERMRIDSSGNLLVGTTSTSANVAGFRVFNSGRINASDSTVPFIAVRLSTDGEIIQLKKDTTTVGSIGTNGDLLFMSSANGAGFRLVNDDLRPSTGSTNADDTYDLGHSNVRWKDLYLSGNIYLGGTTSANALDDYEEGTYNPFATATQPANVTYSSARYTKIGRFVFCTIKIRDQRSPKSAVVFDMPFADTAGGDRVYGIEFAGNIRNVAGTATRAQTSGGGEYAYGTYVIESG